MRALLLTSALMGLWGAAPTLAAFSGQCPAGDTIKQTRIPSSVNCAYSAESDGVGFGGFNNCGLVGLPFAGGRVSEINGYWSLDCSYVGSGLNNTLSVGPDAVIKTCHFPDGSLTCSGTRQQCRFTCGEKPKTDQDVPAK